MSTKIMEFFEKIVENLSAIFRHVLPGCVIAGFAWLSHPSWFDGFDRTEPKHLWTVGLVLVIVGNLAYAIHRAIVHQLVDYAVSGIWEPKKYAREVVAPMIEKHVLANERRRHLIHLKNAQIILSAIFAEVCFVASLCFEPGSHVAAQPLVYRWVGGALFVLTVFAHFVSQRAERSLPDTTLEDKNPN